MIRIRLPFPVPELRAERGDVLSFSFKTRRFVVAHEVGSDAACRVVDELFPDGLPHLLMQSPGRLSSAPPDLN